MYQIKTVSFLIGFISLLTGLYLGEDLTGAAKYDSSILMLNVEAFSKNLINGFKF